MYPARKLGASGRGSSYRHLSAGSHRILNYTTLAKLVVGLGLEPRILPYQSSLITSFNTRLKSWLWESDSNG